MVKAMHKHTIRPEDIDAPPSPLLKNYVEFNGEHLTPEERADLFRGEALWLPRVAELAVRKYMVPPATEEQAS